jgi:hypothetical protein
MVGKCWIWTHGLGQQKFIKNCMIVVPCSVGFLFLAIY